MHTVLATLTRGYIEAEMGRVEEPDREDLYPHTGDECGLFASKATTYQGLQNSSIMGVMFEVPTRLRSGDLRDKGEMARS